MNEHNRKMSIDTNGNNEYSSISKEAVLMSKAETITVPIKVDTKELEKSLQLAKELETTLEKANRLLDQLTSGKN